MKRCLDASARSRLSSTERGFTCRMAGLLLPLNLPAKHAGGHLSLDLTSSAFLAPDLDLSSELSSSPALSTTFHCRRPETLSGDHIARHNMDASPFKRLPAELRLQVYELVLTHYSDIHLLDRGGKIICANALHDNDPLRFLALTRTCKAVRSESLSVFYDCNTFFWNSTPDTSAVKGALVKKYSSGVSETRVFKKWLKAIGENNAKAIKRLTFDMGFWSSVLPVELAVQVKWWRAAREEASVLKEIGLAKMCELNALDMRELPDLRG